MTRRLSAIAASPPRSGRPPSRLSGGGLAWTRYDQRVQVKNWIGRGSGVAWPQELLDERHGQRSSRSKTRPADTFSWHPQVARGRSPPDSLPMPVRAKCLIHLRRCVVTIISLDSIGTRH